MSQLLITRQGQTIVSASHQETEGITQFHVVPSEEIRSGEADGDFRIGDIYLGLVQNIVPRIGAAFVQIAPGQNGYLPLNENRHFCFANPKNTEKLCIGDKLLVQIDKEPVKTKPVSLTTEFTLSGKYAVLLPYQPEVRVSTKIREKAERERLWNIGDSCLAEYGYGCIFRTNAAGHEDGELHAALRRLAEQFQSIRDKGIHALRHAKLYSGIPAYLADLRDAGEEELTKIQTDDPELYREMAEFLTENQPEDLPKLSLYRDEQISLSALYSIQTRLEKALAPKVWMKSGAYLVIEHTEALTVIDVNSGKAVKGKRSEEESARLVNLEAAETIASELKLRNLSGIILVDFINMKEPAHKEEVENRLRKLIQADPVKTVFVDTTALGLVELTRKRASRPLHEYRKLLM